MSVHESVHVYISVDLTGPPAVSDLKFFFFFFWWDSWLRDKGVAMMSFAHFQKRRIYLRISIQPENDCWHISCVSQPYIHWHSLPRKRIGLAERRHETRNFVTVCSSFVPICNGTTETRYAGKLRYTQVNGGAEKYIVVVWLVESRQVKAITHKQSFMLCNCANSMDMFRLKYKSYHQARLQ